ncbi:ssDNA-binding protein [Comamonas antarctica]|uniref:ssDNA-binding protein n=1 Tax=Comamonas antarctica TaxID=2743470 RepID=UPI0028EB1875|nr:ssDNA-binding protein [Comamonas antarctica]
MASNFASSPSVILKGLRLQWGDLFTAASGEVNGKPTTPKFKAVGLMEPNSEAFNLAKNSMLAAARELWGPNAESVVAAIATNSKALRNGNGKLLDDGSVNPQFKDLFFISASNKSKPQIVAPRLHNGKFVVITEDGRGMVDGIDVTNELGYVLKAPYRGCYVNMKVQFVAGKSFKAPSGEMLPNQVYAKLEAVQFLRDGEAFGAGPTSAEGFGDEEVSQETVDANSLF